MQNLFQGIIENNNDPLKLYRCQVRIFGIHTENKSDSEQDSYIPVEDLPWADVLTNGSGMDGQGEFIPIAKGTTVIISFLDPEQQRPIIIGTLPRYVVELPNFDSGFSDPDQIHPKEENLDESTISRLSRNEKISDTIIQDKIDAVKTSVDCNGVTWDEPQTAYNTIYPNNRVIQTKNHVFEMDDSDGVERVHIYHKSGSSKEWHPNGDEVNITKAKKFTIVISDNDILIEGNQNVHISGSQNILIAGNENEKINGNNIKDISGNQDINISGSQSIDIGGNQDINISGSQNIDATTAITLSSPIINLDGLVNVGNGLNVINGSSGTFSGDINMTGVMSGAGSINLAGSILTGTANSNKHSH